MRQAKGYYNYDRKCVECGNGFKGTLKQNRCSKACVLENEKYIKPYPGLPTGTVGAIQELRVSIDLMANGYEVFRAISPSCSCDLLALKNGKMFDVEVRTGYERKNGWVGCPNQGIRAKHLVIALPDRLVYKPVLC